jgi:hypothetical protein
MDNIQTLDLSFTDNNRRIISCGYVHISCRKQKINMQEPVDVILPSEEHTILSGTFRELKKINNIKNLDKCTHLSRLAFDKCELSESVSKLVEQKLSERPIHHRPAVGSCWYLYYNDCLISKFDVKESDTKWVRRNNSLEYVNGEWVLTYNNNTVKNSVKTLQDTEIEFDSYKCVFK